MKFPFRTQQALLGVRGRNRRRVVGSRPQPKPSRLILLLCNLGVFLSWFAPAPTSGQDRMLEAGRDAVVPRSQRAEAVTGVMDPCGGADHEFTLDLLLFADYTAKYGDAAMNNALALIDLINPVFRAELDANLRVVDMHAFVGSDPFGSSTSDETLLKNIAAWRGANIVTPGLGSVVAFTARRLDVPSQGIAYTGSLCGLFGIGLVSDFGSPAPVALINQVVTAHMIGHNMGMNHDGTGNACSTNGFIMTTIHASASMTFSTCSRNYWNAFRLQGAVCVIPPATQPGDADCNGRIDAADVIPFVGCLAGPDHPVFDECLVFDFDEDGDADLSDFAEFQNLFNGSHP